MKRQIEAATIFSNLVKQMEILANEGRELTMINSSFFVFDFIFREDVNVMPVDAEARANAIAEFVSYLGRIEAAGLDASFFEAR
ncbi:MAG: hypothetical protein AAGE61_20710 [Pseudomonadota bacterium]